MKELIIGKARDPHDKEVFHSISLIAFLAWVGLGADGISSSCYGPEETFKALGTHSPLSIFVGIGCALTVLVIATSYSQIIELFPAGGGGYLMASKLLNPNLGMVSGCALLIDYVLTITISIASGADALFSFFDPGFQPAKFWFAVFGVVLLTLMNLRGVKEAVLPLVPIFLTFLLAHFFIIGYAIVTHFFHFSTISDRIMTEIEQTHVQLGWWGMIFLVLHAYSMSAGTYTGIEAVSNGLPILKDPKVETGKRTMKLMAFSLAGIVLGLLIAYLLYEVQPVEGKTLNAVLCERVFADFPSYGRILLFITLFSEATLLFVAAQAGFLDGPRVLANMAQDRWFPTRFAMLSDRLVAQNGILLMSVSSLVLLFWTRGSVGLLVILYSINVFITFSLSQLGMVKHWWLTRGMVPNWRKKLFINGLGFLMTAFILISVTWIKFNEGGWITLVITGTLVFLAWWIRSHYHRAFQLLQKFQTLADTEDVPYSKAFLRTGKDPHRVPAAEATGKTAAFLVNGFNGQGFHCLLKVFQMFPGFFQNFVFLQIGMIDAGNFKGAQEVQALETHVRGEGARYISFMNHHGYFARSYSAISVDVVEATKQLADEVRRDFPNSTFFGGQLIFPEDSFVSKILHNHVVFAVQREFCKMGVPFIVLPVVI
ncbi:APC family permease [bacterium]|nr:APC family permease [bacterium]